MREGSSVSACLYDEPPARLECRWTFAVCGVSMAAVSSEGSAVRLGGGFEVEGFLFCLSAVIRERRAMSAIILSNFRIVFG